MSAFSIKEGQRAELGKMRFTLAYDGPLASNGRPPHKQAIREHFHPQLAELWETRQSLKEIAESPYAPPYIAGLPYVKTYDASGALEPVDDVNLCEPVIQAGVAFLPLVRARLKLTCSLSIQYLRKEEPGRLFQEFDLDNRIKTILDALTAPRHPEQVARPTISGPIYCLLEDDSLITGFEIQSRRMLGRNDAAKNDVRMLIDVEVRVAGGGLRSLP